MHSYLVISTGAGVSNTAKYCKAHFNGTELHACSVEHSKMLYDNREALCMASNVYREPITTIETGILE